MEIARDKYYEVYRRFRWTNWIPLGLMYGSYYMGRYNIYIANKDICEEFGWNKSQIGIVFMVWYWAYAFGQLVNGIITDKIGGRKAIMIGALATIILNLLFGATPWGGVLAYFIMIWCINGYFQAFGAPSIVKVNANWFSLTERGTFTGIFGFMIQLGRFGINFIGPIVMATYGWRYAFFVPPMITFSILVLTFFTVKDNPEDCGFKNFVKYGEGGDEEPDEKPPELGYIFKKVFTSKILWIISGAYFCTGVVRHGLDAWFPRYMQEVQNIELNTKLFLIGMVILPLSAVLGSVLAGWCSDHLFHGRRGPIAAIMYFSQFVLLIIFLKFPSPVLAMGLYIVLQVFVNGPHSLLGGAASMDFGGRKAAGAASGLIDAWQYIGAGTLGAGFFTGWLIESYGWDAWIYTLLIGAILGGILMVSIWNVLPSGEKHNGKNQEA